MDRQDPQPGCAPFTNVLASTEIHGFAAHPGSLTVISAHKARTSGGEVVLSGLHPQRCLEEASPANALSMNEYEH